MIHYIILSASKFQMHPFFSDCRTRTSKMLRLVYLSVFLKEGRV